MRTRVGVRGIVKLASGNVERNPIGLRHCDVSDVVMAAPDLDGTSLDAVTGQGCVDKP